MTRRTLPALFALVALALPACLTEVDSTPRPEQVAAAKRFAETLIHGGYAAAAGNFEAALAQDLDADRLRGMWEETTARVGAPEHLDGVRAAQAEGLQIVYVRSKHAEGDIDIRLVFKDSTAIRGVWFRPADDHKSYQAL